MRGERWRHVLAIPVALLFLAPLVYMVTGSLREAGLPPPRTPELLPSPITLDGYPRAFELVDLPLRALNSLVVAAVAAPLSVIFASWAGFALSRLSPRMRATLIAISLVALMVPATALLVGRFAIFRTVGVLDTYWPLIAPSLLGMSPFYVLLFYWGFRRIPGELFDAARVEGLSPFALWRRVAMPLVGPVTTAVFVLAFVTSWSNFLDPLIYLFDERNFTLPLALRSLAELDRSNFPLFLAGAVTATLPVVVAFLVVQRRFLSVLRS